MGLWIRERAELEGWRLREGKDRVEQGEALIQSLETPVSRMKETNCVPDRPVIQGMGALLLPFYRQENQRSR